MTTDFDRAVAIILHLEKGYVNHPDDPGGETNFGISKRRYPNEDIRAMTAARATELYRRDFWLPECDSLPWPLSLYVFDVSVNSGPSRARKLLPATPEEYLWKRAAFYTSLVKKKRSNIAFLAGWINRLVELRMLGASAPPV